MVQHCLDVSVVDHLLNQPAKGCYNQVTAEDIIKPAHFACSFGHLPWQSRSSCTRSLLSLTKEKISNLCSRTSGILDLFSGLWVEKYMMFVIVLKAVAWFYLYSDFVAFRLNFTSISRFFFASLMSMPRWFWRIKWALILLWYWHQDVGFTKNTRYYETCQ